jgi:hypothetical protein
MRMTIDLGLLSPGFPGLTGALPGAGARPGAPRCVRFLTLLLTIFAVWLFDFSETQPDAAAIRTLRLF